MFSDISGGDDGELVMEYRSAGTETGPDAVAELQASEGGRLIPMYASSTADSFDVEVDTAENGTQAVASGGSTPSLTLNPVFGATGEGEEITGLRVTNGSDAASDAGPFVRAIEIRIE